jgi:hypothetical protein
MATLQNDPWPENAVPKLNSLDDLHAWIAPLVAEERGGNFSGRRAQKANAVESQTGKALEEARPAIENCSIG